MFQVAVFLAAVLAPTPTPPDDTRVLTVGDEAVGVVGVVDRVATSRSVKPTAILRGAHLDLPVHATTYRLSVVLEGRYTLEASSPAFDVYLVLADAAGSVLAEDDRSWFGSNARIVRTLAAETRYEIRVCALHGGSGSFRLRVVPGDPVELTPAERQVALEQAATALASEAATSPALRVAGHVYWEQGDYGTAERCFARALDAHRRSSEDGAALAALLQADIASACWPNGKYDEAIDLARRSLDVLGGLYGDDHGSLISPMNSTGAALTQQGKFAEARPWFERSLALCERHLGSEHPSTLNRVNNLAVVLELLGDFAAAAEAHRRALSIRERVLGADHPDTALSLHNLATASRLLGDYHEAQDLYERALTIRRATLGDRHPDTAGTLDDLGAVLHARGLHDEARRHHEAALEVREAVLGLDHRDTAASLNNLGNVLQAQGNYEEARRLYGRALTIREAQLGATHPETAWTLNNLANVHASCGEAAEARRLHERALQIREETLGPQHPDTAYSLHNLAWVLETLGDFASARHLYERALAVRETALGTMHPDTAWTLNSLGRLFSALGDFDRGQAYLERALRTREALFGPGHLHTAWTVRDLARLLADTGRTREAWKRATASLADNRAHVERVGSSLTESERFLLAGMYERDLGLVLSLARAIDDPAVTRRAFGETLHWKGRISRSLAETRERLHRGLSSEEREWVKRLREVQARISRAVYRRNKDIDDRRRHEEELAALRTVRHDLESRLTRRNTASSTSTSIDDLQRRLPAGAAFVDYLVYRSYELAPPSTAAGTQRSFRGRWGEDRLLAWVVRGGSEAIELVDLGDAATARRMTRAYLDSLRASRGVGYDTAQSLSRLAGEELRAIVWDPLMEELANVEQVFVSPDRFLGSLPFGILPVAKNEYLIEKLDLRYVQDASTLVQLMQRERSGVRTDLFTVGAVDYRKRAADPSKPGTAAKPHPAAAGDASIERGSVGRFWTRLPATSGECMTVLDLHEERFEDAPRLYVSGEDATEERVKAELPRHAVVHLATHGFFHPKGLPSMWEQAQLAAAESGERSAGEAMRLTGMHPGLLSGLVFAGANKPVPEARDDGLLTAEEVSWIDLGSCDLVVLSACETSLGTEKGGEGMIGLRRAFRLAGAKSVVSSLWAVDDETTGELMGRFYYNLWIEDMSRGDALRSAQLEMLRTQRIRDDGTMTPFHWGAFVLHGEWR